MTVEPQQALLTFRHAYSTLCMTMIHALKSGKDRERVRRAAGAGGLLMSDRYLNRVRQARMKANLRLEDAKRAGVDRHALIETAQIARDTIEREHEVHLPLRSKT